MPRFLEKSFFGLTFSFGTKNHLGKSKQRYYIGFLKLNTKTQNLSPKNYLLEIGTMKVLILLSKHYKAIIILEF